MSRFDYEEIKEKDIAWYFAIRVFIIIVVAISYIMSILSIQILQLYHVYIFYHSF